LQNAFFILLGVLIGAFAMTNGLLLAIWPKHFLRFYDRWARGDYVGRSASWRKEVTQLRYKLLGAGLFAVGAAVIWDIVHKVL